MKISLTLGIIFGCLMSGFSEDVMQPESVRIVSSGDVCFLASADRVKLRLANVLTGSRKFISLNEPALAAFAQDNGNVSALVIGKDGNILLFNRENSVIYDSGESDLGKAMLVGSLSRGNEIFYVGYLRWDKNSQKVITYCVYNVRNDKVEELGNIERREVGVLSRFKNQIWLITDGDCEKLAFSVETEN